MTITSQQWQDFSLGETAIAPKHFQEWLNSAVDPEIIKLNVRSVEGREAYSCLLYSDKLQRTNTGVLSRGIQRQYEFLYYGSWHCSGVDPLNNWEPMLWGCLKPNRPRFDFEKRKHIKYEHPPKTETRIFLLDVPDHIWQKVSDRYGIPIADEDRQRGFWHWVWKNNVPIVITEGAKKAGALLTAGFAAMALPGIYGGYRTPKDEYGNQIGKPYLIPDLKHFATLGREVSFCFDRDVKQKTIRHVNKAIEKTGFSFSQLGCKVRVISWEQPQKGVDDLIVAHGADAFIQAYQSAPSLESWQAQSFTQLTYSVNVTVNHRYLGEVAIPEEAKLIAIKSPKGSGKTKTLEGIVADAIASGKWVLVVTHRVQLGEAICNRVGVPYISESKDCEFGRLLGFGLCVNSLHPKSHARFDAEKWRGDGIVIFDECEQVLWHALNSSTCQRQRIPILRQLKTLLGNLLAPDSKGRVILSDADLSDLAIDYVRSLSGHHCTPWVLVNGWKPGADDRWRIHNYGGKNPSQLVQALIDHIAAGGRPFVCCSAQKVKSKWGTRTLEALLQKQFPSLRILRIDAETIADPSHPAYGCIGNLDAVLQQYDIVLTSPTLETGVSIDIRGHFTSVWGIFQGVQSEATVRQWLARLRENVARHIWAASYGFGKVGNGSTSVKSLLASQNQVAKANIRLLQESSWDDLELNPHPESLLTWAKMAVRVNLGMNHYRSSILEGLQAEGHEIVEVGENDDGDAIKEEATAVRDDNWLEEAAAISAAADLSDIEAALLEQKIAKTPDERRKERKHQLKKRYGIPVDPDLVLKDDDGWYYKLLLQYYLTEGREFLQQQDSKQLQAQAGSGGGAIWMPDLNRKQLSARVVTLENLGILDLLSPDNEWRGSDEILQTIAGRAKANAWQVKASLNVSISEKDTPIAIAQKLLDKMGLSLEYLRREGPRGSRQRVYGFVDPGDGREEVFAAWLQRDAETANILVSTPSNIDSLSSADTDTELTQPVSTPSNIDSLSSVDMDLGLGVHPPGSKEMFNSADTNIATPTESTPSNTNSLPSVDTTNTESTPLTTRTNLRQRAVEILAMTGTWLKGYFYVGRRGSRHQLADISGFDGIFVDEKDFRFVNRVG